MSDRYLVGKSRDGGDAEHDERFCLAINTCTVSKRNDALETRRLARRWMRSRAFVTSTTRDSSTTRVLITCLADGARNLVHLSQLHARVLGRLASEKRLYLPKGQPRRFGNVYVDEERGGETHDRVHRESERPGGRE